MKNSWHYYLAFIITALMLCRCGDKEECRSNFLVERRSLVFDVNRSSSMDVNDSHPTQSLQLYSQCGTTVRLRIEDHDPKLFKLKDNISEITVEAGMTQEIRVEFLIDEWQRNPWSQVSNQESHPYRLLLTYYDSGTSIPENPNTKVINLFIDATGDASLSEPPNELIFIASQNSERSDTETIPLGRELLSETSSNVKFVVRPEDIDKICWWSDGLNNGQDDCPDLEILLENEEPVDGGRSRAVHIRFTPTARYYFEGRIIIHPVGARFRPLVVPIRGTSLEGTNIQCPKHDTEQVEISLTEGTMADAGFSITLENRGMQSARICTTWPANEGGKRFIPDGEGSLTIAPLGTGTLDWIFRFDGTPFSNLNPFERDYSINVRQGTSGDCPPEGTLSECGRIPIHVRIDPL